MDLAFTFPLNSFQGVDIVDNASAVFLFYDPNQADSTLVDITIDAGTCKAFLKEFAEHVNYSKESFIVLADASAVEGFSTLIDHDTAVTLAIGS